MIKKSSNGKIGAIHTNSKTTPNYKRIKPYEKDIKTGKYLNESLHDIYIEDGVINTYEISQSHKKECDIYEILRTCQATGTLDPLGNPEKQTYEDITNLPKDIIDTLEKMPNKADIEELTKQYETLKEAMEAATKKEEQKEQEVTSNE